jgi:hypothetical protein
MVAHVDLALSVTLPSSSFVSGRPATGRPPLRGAACGPLLRGGPAAVHPSIRGLEPPDPPSRALAKPDARSSFARPPLRGAGSNPLRPLRASAPAFLFVASRGQATARPRAYAPKPPPSAKQSLAALAPRAHRENSTHARFLRREKPRANTHVGGLDVISFLGGSQARYPSPPR